jgi:hypothetical protein
LAHTGKHSHEMDDFTNTDINYHTNVPHRIQRSEIT